MTTSMAGRARATRRSARGGWFGIRPGSVSPPGWWPGAPRSLAKREVWSFWYPTWLCYPAGMLPGARVLDAPPHGVSLEDTVRIARDYDMVVVHTSTPSFRADARTAQAIKNAKSDMLIGFVGGHVTAMPEESLRAAPVIDYVARKEFDLAVVAIAEGRDLAHVKGISYRRGDAVVH